MSQTVLAGVLIGLGGGLLYLGIGRIAGVSGILRNAFRGGSGAWRVAFLVGLAAGGAVVALGRGGVTIRTDVSTAALVAAGLLTGIGAVVGNGCTSGHGVCGVGRFSTRSLVAVTLFVAVGGLVSHIVRG